LHVNTRDSKLETRQSLKLFADTLRVTGGGTKASQSNQSIARQTDRQTDTGWSCWCCMSTL